jgi:hypothetical protein
MGVTFARHRTSSDAEERSEINLQPRSRVRRGLCRRSSQRRCKAIGRAEDRLRSRESCAGVPRTVRSRPSTFDRPLTSASRSATGLPARRGGLQGGALRSAGRDVEDGSIPFLDRGRSDGGRHGSAVRSSGRQAGSIRRLLSRAAAGGRRRARWTTPSLARPTAPNAASTCGPASCAMGPRWLRSFPRVTVHRTRILRFGPRYMPCDIGRAGLSLRPRLHRRDRRASMQSADAFRCRPFLDAAIERVRRGMPLRGSQASCLTGQLSRSWIKFFYKSAAYSTDPPACDR